MAVVAGVVAIVVVDVDGDFIDNIVGDVVVVYFWISAYSVFSFSTVTVAPPGTLNFYKSYITIITPF